MTLMFTVWDSQWYAKSYLTTVTTIANFQWKQLIAAITQKVKTMFCAKLTCEKEKSNFNLIFCEFCYFTIVNGDSSVKPLIERVYRQNFTFPAGCVWPWTGESCTHRAAPAPRTPPHPLKEKAENNDHIIQLNILSSLCNKKIAPVFSVTAKHLHAPAWG